MSTERVGLLWAARRAALSSSAGAAGAARAALLGKAPSAAPERA
ncbi:hypothetical protein WMF04_08910 [Sorangium sp. So ce260]